MNLHQRRTAPFVVLLVALTGLTSYSLGQNQTPGVANNSLNTLPGISDTAPLSITVMSPEAMVLQQEKELNDQLQHLRRAQSTVGRNHPQYGIVQAEIDHVVAALEGLEREKERAYVGRKLPVTLPSGRETDLQVLARRMESQLEKLEFLITRLERVSRSR